MRKKKSEERRFLNIIILVLIIVFVIITLGVFYKHQNPEELLENKKINLQKRLDQLNIEIQKLELLRKKYEKKERIMFLTARLIVVLFFLSINYVYYCFNNWNMELGDFVNVNSTILFSYTALGFIIYGNLVALNKNIQLILKTISLRKHVLNYFVLKQYRLEKIAIENELKNL